MKELETDPNLIDESIGLFKWKAAECILNKDARLRHKENRTKAFWDNLGFVVCLVVGILTAVAIGFIIFVWWAK